MNVGGRRARRIAALIVLMVSASGCGESSVTNRTPSPVATTTATLAVAAATPSAPTTAATTRTATASPTATATTGPATALFSADPQAAENPFPSDRLRDANGHLQVPFSYLDPGFPDTATYQRAHTYVETVVPQLSTLSGFSTFAPLRVRFDRPVVVDPGENPRGVLLLNYDDLTAPPVTITASVYDPDTTIEVQPLVPLRPKTTYALVLTTALTDADGNHIQPSPAFAAVLAGSASGGDLAAVHAQLQPVVEFVNTAFGIAEGALAVIDVFTTAATTDDLIAIQRRLAGGDLVPGPPVFQNAPISIPTGIFPENTPQFTDLVKSPTSDTIAAVAIGSFDSYDFRSGPKGAFKPEYLTGPAVPPVNHLDFYVTIPKAERPPQGYPIAIFGHGLGGSGRDVVSVPAEIGAAPMMGIAISDLQHGTRGDPTQLFVLNNLGTTREYFRQTIADYLQLERMVRNAQAAGIAPFDQVDPDHIQYFGVSLGGIMGTLYMAVEPDVSIGMLSVPGGGLPNILESHDIGALLEPLISLQLNLSRSDPLFPLFLHRFLSLAQWVMDPADPINYAPHLIVSGEQLPGVPPKQILVHEGIVDNTMPNRTTDDLARAMRLPDLNLSHGCMDADGCSGIWRYVMVDYGQPELSGHSASFTIPQAQMQLTQFLTSFGTAVPDEHP